MNTSTRWAQAVVDGLASAGVAHVVIAPGSRSTPLAAAILADSRLHANSVIDERAAAFFALGIARASGRPAAAVCTSGSAGAHFLPAVLEAEASFTPLILLTADRPWELQHCGAAQTVDQLALFGGHVRFFAALGTPEDDDACIAAARRVAVQAVVASSFPTPGAVHLNVPFCPPLEPDSSSDDICAAEVSGRDAQVSVAPWAFTPVTMPSEEAIAALAAACRAARRGLVVAGPAPATAAPRLREAAARFCAATGFPLLAEVTSQLGCPLRGVATLPGFDVVLGHPATRAGLRPDLVISLGAAPVSRQFGAALETWDQPPHWVIAAHGWNDPHATARDLILAAPAAVLAAVAERIDRSPVDSAWASWVFAVSTAARSGLAAAVGGRVLTEVAVANTVRRHVGAAATLVVGNSLPVRDLDLGAEAMAAVVIHQRGAAGIDGLVAGACGVAEVAVGPVVVLVGDVSLSHDLTSLALAAQAPAPLAIVVLDNGGGRIFDLLPVASAGIDLANWRTPPRIDWAAAAATFNVPHVRVTTVAELTEALAASDERPGATLIQAVVAGEDVAPERARLRAAVAARLDALAPAP